MRPPKWFISLETGQKPPQDGFAPGYLLGQLDGPCVKHRLAYIQQPFVAQRLLVEIAGDGVDGRVRAVQHLPRRTPESGSDCITAGGPKGLALQTLLSSVELNHFQLGPHKTPG